MTEQLSLPNLSVRGPGRDRLLFLILPDIAAGLTLTRLAHGQRAKLGLRRTPFAPERFHITLHHLGDHNGVPPEIVRAAGDAAAMVRFPPFEVVFDRVESFSIKPEGHPFVLRGHGGLAALMVFHQRLAVALMTNGLGHHVASSFTPHVTLLYDDRIVAEQPVNPIRWTVREFALVHSPQGLTQHNILGRWSLTPSSPGA